MLQGAKPIPLAITVAVGLLLRFLIPVPEGVTVQVSALSFQANCSIFLDVFILFCTCGNVAMSIFSQNHLWRQFECM